MGFYNHTGSRVTTACNTCPGAAMDTSRYLTSADGMDMDGYLTSKYGMTSGILNKLQWHQTVYKQVYGMANGDAGSIKAILEAAIDMVTNDPADLVEGKVSKFARDVVTNIGKFTIIEPGGLTARAGYLVLTGVDNGISKTIGKLYEAYKKEHPERVREE